MTATNMCSNFGDFRCRPPISENLAAAEEGIGREKSQSGQPR